MEELELLKECLQKETDFIENMIDYIYDKVEISKASIIEEAEYLILEHNKKIVEQKAKQVRKLQEVLTKPSVVKEKEKKDTVLPEPSTIPVAKKNYKEYLLHMLTDEKTISPLLNTLNEQEIKEFKLSILEELLSLERQIKESIIEDPTRSILPLQEKIRLYKTLLIRIKEETSIKEEDTVFSEVTTQSKRKVLFLPNSKGSTYFAEDIEKQLEKKEELQKAFAKIETGYFLESKDTKSIKDSKEKLYEYTNPNGIRILYIVMGDNTYVICSLFYKDKQKSTKITDYYEEAIRRYKKQEEELLKNINNPNFYIEQAELIGEIYSMLETQTPVLKEVL